VFSDKNPIFRLLYCLNFDFSYPETKKFVDLLFKTLETQVYDAPSTASVTHAATDIEPAGTAEPAPTKIPTTKQPVEPLLSESLNTATAPSAQSLAGHQVSVSVAHQRLM
jgi:hypothetical protein